MSNMRKKINYPLYKALNKYGLEKFEYHIEFILNPEGKTRLTIGGESISGYHQTEETKQRLSEVTKEIQNDGRNKVYIYNILTKEYSE